MSNAVHTGSGPAAWLARQLGAGLPRQCLLCLAPAADALCRECATALQRAGETQCPQCASPTPGGKVCGACLARPPAFDATTAVFRYRYPLDRLVQALKYGHRLAGADFLGAALRDEYAGPRPDLLLPVPLSARRLAERGFNQAVELSRPLARRLGMEMELDAVRRAVDTPPQAGLRWKDRAQNMRHAFECRLDLAGRSVLVVDDVMTTGATLGELAATLRAAGAARVENLVLARAVRDRSD